MVLVSMQQFPNDHLSFNAALIIIIVIIIIIIIMIFFKEEAYM